MKSRSIRIVAVVAYLSVAGVAFGLTMRITDTSGETMIVKNGAMRIQGEKEGPLSDGLAVKSGKASITIPWESIRNVRFVQEGDQRRVQVQYTTGRMDTRTLSISHPLNCLVGECESGRYDILLADIETIDVFEDAAIQDAVLNARELEQHRKLQLLESEYRNFTEALEKAKAEVRAQLNSDSRMPSYDSFERKKEQMRIAITTLKQEMAQGLHPTKTPNSIP